MRAVCSVLFYLFSSFFCSAAFCERITAQAIIFGSQDFSASLGRTDVSILGHVDFIQETDKAVKITGELHGLGPGKHAIHIHTFGNIYKGCRNTKGHYNPHNKTHGGPKDQIRHVGDLGNIIANGLGHVVFNITDAKIQLSGPHSVLGRAVVVHMGYDDLGKGEHKDTLTTGYSPGRAGCGVIGVTSEPPSGAGTVEFKTVVIVVCCIVGLLRYL